MGIKQPKFVRLKCVALHGYRGRLIYCGERYDVDEHDVARLLAEGCAVRESLNGGEESAPRRRTYRRRDMKVED